MIDIPRAWEITRASKDGEHNRLCSWRTHRMLCDCHVIYKHPEQVERRYMFTVGGEMIGAGT